MTTVIIDPCSPEFNRGSFCYSPYILYSALWDEDTDDPKLFEDFSAARIDELPDADNYYIALWSHPQIEHVKTLVRFLPEGRVRVFGYDPLIESLKLPHLKMTEDEILMGIRQYIYHFHKFKQILLSDCDMHLKNCTGQVYPLFTSYGCPNGCTFCPSTTNQPKRLSMHLDAVKDTLNDMAGMGYTNIHFTDEDFFHSPGRAHDIIQHIIRQPKQFQLIALASRHTLASYLTAYGSTELEAAGFKLIEVGLETADTALSASMGKLGLDACERLAQACSIPILWLTLTFYPGETIKSLRATGEFLRRHGMRAEDLYSRIAGNGTYGGLGQFFQPYEGTKNFNGLREQGIILTERPLRLLPSFLPYSFTSCVIKSVHPEKYEPYWYDLYRVAPNLDRLAVDANKTIWQQAKSWRSLEDGLTSLAISARLGVIE